MYNNSNVIVLCFNQYSCGKFLSNILSYNKNFIPQFPFSNERKPIQTTNVDYTQMSFDDLLAAKHDTILRSLPPINETKNWREYELGCEQFWGTYADQLDQTPICNKARWVLDQGKYCFIMGHDIDQANLLVKYFPFATVIKIINDRRINLLSIKLKTDWGGRSKDCLKDFNPDHCLYFDIDSLFNKQRFFENIDRLLADIKIEDRSLDPRVFEYYQKYCDLYRDIV